MSGKTTGARRVHRLDLIKAGNDLGGISVREHRSYVTGTGTSVRCLPSEQRLANLVLGWMLRLEKLINEFLSLASEFSFPAL